MELQAIFELGNAEMHAILQLGNMEMQFIIRVIRCRNACRSLARKLSYRLVRKYEIATRCRPKKCGKASNILVKK